MRWGVVPLTHGNMGTNSNLFNDFRCDLCQCLKGDDKDDDWAVGSWNRKLNFTVQVDRLELGALYPTRQLLVLETNIKNNWMSS